MLDLKESLAQVELSTVQNWQPDAIFKLLKTDQNGLSQEEAEQRLKEYGRNELNTVRAKPLILKFAANFTHLMAILLWLGGLIGFIAQMPQLGLAIWAVNLINGVFSFWQEYEADKATEALQRMLPTFAKVLRAGVEIRLSADQLVPGDILLLAEGDRISADARVLEEAEFRVDQSALTGESRPVRKHAEAITNNHNNQHRAEIPNLIFAGTSVVTGTAQAVILATGMQTEFGKIAHLTQNVAESISPLQKELGRVTKVISFLASGIGVVFFGLAIGLAGVDLATSFIFAMGMIVAFVPEGMLPTVTLSLAMGVKQMAKRNALVKKLSSVETLGCTTVICTDKTGTLTQNEMTVCNIWLGGRTLEVEGVGYDPNGNILENGCPISAPADPDLHQTLVSATLCNDARLIPPHEKMKHWSEIGDPTEAALETVALKGGIEIEEELKTAPRLKELPFDSRRKRMSTIHKIKSERVAYVKGAPRELLALCNYILWQGEIIRLDEALRAQVMAANDNFAGKGLRILAIAKRNLPSDLIDLRIKTVENDLLFLGLVAMSDPPRPEVAGAVEKCQQAGIRIIMITGDYELTAQRIAFKLGIVRNEKASVITGSQLEQLSETDLATALQREAIFARVSPEHKLRVVTTLQKMGQIVAVTGDGVNDAPALKKADIGVAMGLAGTDVAKEAADMILTDDNFASIVNAVEIGRAVYNNIRKFATYVFNSNMAEAVPFALMLFSRGAIPLPLTVMQVLAIDLGTDMLPAIGLGAEAPEAGIMNRPPRSRQEPLLNPKLLARALLWYGLIEAIAAMSAYFFINWRNGFPAVPLAQEGTTLYAMATTMTLAGVVACQVGAVFACRTERLSIFKTGFFTNRLVLIGVGVELILLILLIYFPPFQSIFNTAPLGLVDWLFVLAWTPLIILVDEARKAWLRHKEVRNP
jgi:P-type Ca2+ transporter type 2C